MRNILRCRSGFNISYIHHCSRPDQKKPTQSITQIFFPNILLICSKHYHGQLPKDAVAFFWPGQEEGKDCFNSLRCGAQSRLWGRRLCQSLGSLSAFNVEMELANPHQDTALETLSEYFHPSHDQNVKSIFGQRRILPSSSMERLCRKESHTSLIW